MVNIYVHKRAEDGMHHCYDVDWYATQPLLEHFDADRHFYYEHGDDAKQKAREVKATLDRAGVHNRAWFIFPGGRVEEIV